MMLHSPTGLANGSAPSHALQTSAYVRSIEFQTATVRGGDIIRVTASKQSFIGR